MKKEINKIITTLTSEENADRWFVLVAEIFKRFGPEAIDNILEVIEQDQLTEPDPLGIKSLQNSAKWNSLALTYLRNGFPTEALKIFNLLISREPDNSATQNNLGIALMAIGDLAKARVLFTKAFNTDKKRAPDKAEEMPAYQNLILLEKVKSPFLGRAQIAGNPSFHNIIFMDIVGFSRPTWYGTIQVEKIGYLNETVRTLLGEFGLDYRQIPVLPTGDGMALFFESVEHPIKLAIELTKRLDEYNRDNEEDMKLELRYGIHAGDSFPVEDLHGGGNRCGPAINTARRVLDLGSSRHILCTREYAERLKTLFGPTYSALFHDCGEYSVKHGEKLNICNIHDKEFGNPECPNKQ